MIFASDLDGTLIHRAQPDQGPLHCVEVYQGQPLSFITNDAVELLPVLADRVLIVPATTRLPHQYHRLNIPWGVRPWVVAANGAVVLRAGETDEDWAATMRAEFRRLALDIPGALAWAGRLQHLHPQAELRLREAPGMFCYLVGNPSAVSPDQWESHRTDLAGSGWVLSVQRRKVYLMPGCVDKASAVAYVSDLLGRPVLAAAGDSLLDATLVASARFAAVPPNGELADAVLGSHVTRLTGVGPLVGERLLTWLVDVVGRAAA